MSDHAALFHCPTQISDDELATARSRIRSANLLPWEGAVAFGGAYYLINQFVRRSFIRLHYLGGSIVTGYLFGMMILDHNYIERKGTFKVVYDNQTVRADSFARSPFVEGTSEVIGAHEARWINYFLGNNMLAKHTFNPDDNAHPTSRSARVY